MSSETPLFFHNDSGKKIFGILYRAEKDVAIKHNDTVIIYCRPLFGEFHTGHRVMSSFARFALNKGFHFFRFDYYGDGDSEGSFEETSVSSRLSDISSALTFVVNEVKPSRIFLMGVRFGGSMSIFAAEKLKNITGIIAWSPIIDLKAYIYNILRVNLTNQMVVHKEITQNREELIKRIESGKSVNIEGYRLCNPLWEECYRSKIIEKSNVIQNPHLVVQISPSPRIESEFKSFVNEKNNLFEFKHIRDRKFWIPQKIVYSAYNELFDYSLEWIKEKSK